MEKDVREITVLVCLLFSAARITQVDAIKEPRVRHLFAQKRAPLPGTPRNVFTVEREALDNRDQDVHNIFSSVRRSLNPDLRSGVSEMFAITADGPGLVSGPRTMNIPVDERPPTESAPRNVTAAPINGTAVELSWQPPQYSAHETTYYIYYGTVLSGAGSMPVGSTTSRSFIVGSLQQGYVYVFEVSLGRFGPHSYPVNSKPKSELHPVHSVKAVVVNVTSVIVTWQKPVDVENSDIKNYQIKAICSDRSGSQSMTRYTKGGESYLFKYLKFNTRYTFEVWTVFIKDSYVAEPVNYTASTGPFSASVNPLQATQHQGNSVTLTWSVPRTMDAKKVKFYKVTWNCSRCYRSSYYSTEGSKIVVKATNFTLKKLERSYKYVFTVYAETFYGTGESANTSLTLYYYFGRVENLKANVDDYSMTVHWNAPQHINVKDIQYYSVGWYKSTSSYYWWYNWQSTNVTAPLTNFKLNVSAGYTYVFYVSAVTVHGAGSSTSVRKSIPPLGETVSYAHADVIGRYGLQVRVHWNYWGGDAEHYEVSWQCMSGGRVPCYQSRYGWTTIFVNTTSVIANMTSYDTPYVIKITLITSRGRGAPYTLYAHTSSIRAVISHFTCNITKDETHLDCYWSIPTDAEPLGFRQYLLWYHCSGCVSGYITYSSVSSFNQTAAKLRVGKGARYTVKIRIETRFGHGAWVETSVVIPSTFGPVLNLTAQQRKTTGSSRLIPVHLSWRAPSLSSNYSVEYYVVITACTNCGLGTEKNQTGDTYLDIPVPCGNTYTFSVRAVVSDTFSGIPTSSDENKVNLVIETTVAAVTNLAVKFVPGENETVWIARLKDAFHLMWGKPRGLNRVDIEYYQVVVWDTKTTKHLFTKSMDANTTDLLIHRTDAEDLDDGHNYTFQVRCKAQCGFGRNATVTGFFRNVLQVHFGPVLNLTAQQQNTKGSSRLTHVHLTWCAPLLSTKYSVEYYVVTSLCVNCGLGIDKHQTGNTSVDLRVPCGNTYMFVVRAVISGTFSEENNVNLTVVTKVGAVTNLAVKFVPGKSETLWIARLHDAFHLTWGKPKGVSQVDIESYQVVVWETNTTRHTFTKFMDANTTHLLIYRTDAEDLDDGHNYTFQVRCKAQCGFGRNATATGFFMVLGPTHSAPTSGKQIGHKEGLNAAVWAVPVAIVGLILIIIMVYFIRKSRHLERNMYLIMTRLSKDDSDDDVPLFNQFSEDEPLVTA